MQEKVSSISMNRLNVLSKLKLVVEGPTVEDKLKRHRVHTVSSLPKVQSLDASRMDEVIGQLQTLKMSSSHAGVGGEKSEQFAGAQK